jgi:hypothetical protein
MSVDLPSLSNLSVDAPLPAAGLSRGKMLGLVSAAVSVPTFALLAHKLYKKYHPEGLPPEVEEEKTSAQGPLSASEVAKHAEEALDEPSWGAQGSWSGDIGRGARTGAAISAALAALGSLAHGGRQTVPEVLMHLGQGAAQGGLLGGALGAGRHVVQEELKPLIGPSKDFPALHLTDAAAQVHNLKKGLGYTPHVALDGAEEKAAADVAARYGL